MNERNELLISQRYNGHPLKGHVQHALETAERFHVDASATRSNKDLSDEGRSRRLHSQTKGALRDVRDAAGDQIAQMKKRSDGLLAAMAPLTVDKSDLAGALVRQELRTAMRGMAPGDRMALLLGDHADDAYIDAALETAPAQSGLDKLNFDLVREQRLETRFSPQIDEVERLTADIESAESGLELARNDIARSSQLGSHEFEALRKEVDAKKGAPWLRRERGHDGLERIVIVPLSGGAARPASPDEIRDGKFFANVDEYRADRAA